MINIAILGYGNLGRGVECAIKNTTDMKLSYVFTRRAPETVKILTEDATVCHIDELISKQNEIDVLIICGGSATDLPVQTPEYVKYFNVIDSFDTHAKIPEHFENVNKSALTSGLYANAVLPNGQDYTFWGKGVSQGHSDAIRRIDGVIDARQYTVPVVEAVNAVRNGENPTLTTRQKHTRVCYVVADDNADKALIEKQPDYAKNFKFSIIQVFLNKDDTSLYILEREKYWKSVFETGIFGYNKN